MSEVSNQKMDLVVSFDTTGSMYPVLSQVRQEVQKFVHQMFDDFTDLRLGIIAHGDYCDYNNPYTIRIMDMTRDEDKICDFVMETKKTFGGDADECYELVLNSAHKRLNWRSDATKIMIMIGDAAPHGVYYRDNEEHLDWQIEAKKIASQGIKVFAVHALSYYRSSSKGFYKQVADITDGVYLTLDQFSDIINLIKATCYQQGGEEQLNKFISIIRDNGELTHSMKNNFKRLKGEIVEDGVEHRSSEYRRSSYRRSSRDEDVTIKEMGELVPVMPGRFQIMTVDENCDIKGFVEKNGIAFKKGRGFYELSKAETVQQYKEVIMQDRETGEMFNGSQVREKLGLQPQSEKGGVNERLHKADAEKFRVFVQSTSVNRKLIAGTTFLYEVSDLEDTGTVIEESKVAPVEKVDAKTEKVEAKTEKKSKKKSKKAPEKKVAKETIAEAAEKVVVVNPAFSEGVVVNPAFSEPVGKLADTLGIDTSKIDTSSSAVDKKDKGPKKATKAKKAVDRTRIEKAIANVQEGLSRYELSTNKKNTTYLVNNIKKLVAEANKIIALIEDSEE